MAIDTQSQINPALTTPSLRLEDVSVNLGERVALSNVSLEIEPGSFVGLVGPNGSGKSTLLRAVLGVVPLAGGRVLVDGRTPAAARDAFAYLPQRQQVEMDLPLRAWDVVMMGRLRRRGWLRGPGKQDRDIVSSALERVGLLDRRNSAIGEMSYGQQQRVFLARCLVQQGRIVCLDEPMNGVDSATQEVFGRLLASLRQEGCTVLMATHDLNQAADLCSHICLLDNRLVAFGRPAEILRPEVLQRAYGAHIHFLETPGTAHAQILEDVHHHATDRHDHA